MTKQELREQVRQRRDAIPPEKKKKLDAAIVAQIAASKEFKNCSVVLLYAPVGSEPNLLSLVRIARNAGIRVAFPLCDTATCTVEFRYLEGDARLSRGAYGIPEPPHDAERCVPDERMLCVVPGLTFSPSGGRLGWGKGYYDRFLADFPGIAAGAVYEGLTVRELPTEPHDRPVGILFTEQKKYHTGRTNFRIGILGTVLEKKIKPFARLLRSRLLPEKSGTELTGTEGGTQSAKVRALHAPPILVLTVYLLLLLSRLIETNLVNRSNEYLAVILLQLLIFLIPAVLYCKWQGENFTERIRMRLIRPEHFWFCFCVLVVMITGGLLLSILTGGIGSLSGNFTLYDTFVARIGANAWDTIYVILAYGVLPAFCEELVFRSVLCAGYEKNGVWIAVTASALFFAMLHFSLPLFPSYLFLGAMLAGAMYATRSFLSAFLLHFLYNLFCLFGQPYLSAFYVNAGSNEIFTFCLLVLFLLFAAFCAGEARKIYHLYAMAGLDSGYTVSLPARKFPEVFVRVNLSPAVLLCVIVWLIASIIGLVRS